MKSLALSALLLAVLVPYASAQDAGDIAITRAGSQPSIAGEAAHFTGAVRVDSFFLPKSPSRIGGGYVTFEPGARTAWHTHPLGQTLIVTAGVGRVQKEGGPIQEIRPGDVVWIPPGVKHWHGANPSTSMTHLAVAEALDGNAATWLEKVSDKEYGR